jgi:hypothetical protein
MDLLTKIYQEAEEKVVKDVLRALLKREPTIEDAKNTQRLFKPSKENGYTLAHLGIEVGEIEYKYPSLEEMNFSGMVTFTPHEKYK